MSCQVEAGMVARLIIAESAYALLEAQDSSWPEIANLPGGAVAFLASAGPLDKGRLEAAIEIAEDWLMPPTARHGRCHEVTDVLRGGRSARGEQ